MRFDISGGSHYGQKLVHKNNKVSICISIEPLHIGKDNGPNNLSMGMSLIYSHTKRTTDLDASTSLRSIILHHTEMKESADITKDKHSVIQEYGAGIRENMVNPSK